MITESRARDIAERVIKLSKADEVFVSLSDVQTAHIRFARNAPTTSGESAGPRLTVTSSFGKRSGSATVNQLDDATLERAVRSAESVAQLAPEDPEGMPVLGPQQLAASKSYFESTATSGHEGLVQGVAACLDESRRAQVVSAGYTEVSAGMSCVASSRGLFAYHASTETYLSQTARTENGTGSGWASGVGNRLDEIDYPGIARTAVNKCKTSVDARELPPGDYAAILEPTCVASMVELLVSDMDLRRAEEGRSFFAKKGGASKLGERLFAKSITLRSDPLDPRAPARTWAGDGQPQRARAWIESGVVKSLSTSRYWAEKTKREPVPTPANVLMDGGEGSLEDLIRKTKKGLLVTSIWYIRSVDPQSLLHTGLTRDGVYWVENGEIRYPVKNFRWNESPVAMLDRVVAMSKPVRVAPRGGRDGGIVVPALLVDRFHFSSISEAV